MLAATLAVAGAMLISASPATAQAIDLGSDAEVTLAGEQPGDLAASSVGGGCDVDDDGRDDQVVGSFTADPAINDTARANGGAAYVVPGDEPAGSRKLGEGGFRILGGAAGDNLGFDVDCAGDVNGDGRDEVIVGAFNADPEGRSGAGSAYVVFGKDDNGDVDLNDLGDQGFRIDGAVPGDGAGSGVGEAGDVNKDGKADVLVGANTSDANGENSGAAYLVFGKSGTAPVDLDALGDKGFPMIGAGDTDGRAGLSLTDAGDVDGDDRPDILVGAYTADPDARDNAGEAYVVFGKDDTDEVDLGSLGDDGYRIEGALPGDRLGISVAGAGDVNRDGQDDLLLGADQGASNTATGYAFVLYGKDDTDPVDLALPAAEGGYRLEGASPGDDTGYAVDSAGDVNADGRPDAIVGAYNADPLAPAGGDTLAPRVNAGTTYVIYGRETNVPNTVPLALLETRPTEGFRLDGAEAGDRAGRGAAGAGDANDDGADDLFVGADQASPGDGPPTAPPTTPIRTGASYRVLAPEPPDAPDSPDGDEDDIDSGGGGGDGGNGGGGNGGGNGNGNDGDASDEAAPPALTPLAAAVIGRPECAAFPANFGTPARLDVCAAAAGRGLLEPGTSGLTICREAGFRGRKRPNQTVSDLSACQIAVARTRTRLTRLLGLPPATG